MLFFARYMVQAQLATGDILGTVTDPSGAVVANAKVLLTNTRTGETHTVQSNTSGDYVFSLLQAGDYSVRISATGFEDAFIDHIPLNAGHRNREDVKLAVGQNTQTVEVTGGLPGLETDTSVLSTTVTDKQVQDLPLNGRNFVQLAQLAAGADEGTASAISNGNRADDRRQTAAISVDAQSTMLNNELVDGMDNNEHVVGTIGVRPSIDAIAEFQVQTNVYPSEVGNTPGAVVNLITKSGSNTIHGSAYEFLRNDIFDGRYFFATLGPKPEFRQNQFGGSIGGPIRTDKTFYFGDYEGLRIIQGTTRISTVPTLFEEQHPGNLSDIGGPVIPASQLNPIALKYFALYPAPNLPGKVNNFQYSPNFTQYSTTYDTRIDQQFSPNNRFFARYTYNDVTTFTPGGLPAVNGIQPGGSVAAPGNADESAQQILVDDLHTFTPNVALELKAGYTRINNESLPLNYGQNDGNKFGIVNSNLNQITSALPEFAIAGYATLGDSNYLPLIDLDNIFQYAGSLTQTRGTHTLMYGAALIRRHVEEAQNAAGPGFFVFIPTPSKYVLANVLQGNPFIVSRNYQLFTPRLRLWQPSVYVQDDWRVTQWLTLNLGLRYDITTPDTEAHGHISNFDPATASVIVPGINGGSPTAGVRQDYHGLAPRLGFAANIKHGTVLRGGYGIVYFRDDSAPDLPFENQPYTFNYSPNHLTVPLSAPLPIPVQEPITSITSQSLKGLLVGMQLNYRTAYVQQFNLNIEQDIGMGVVFRLGYVGELGRHERITPNIDLAPPAPNQAGCSFNCFVPREPYHAQLPNATAIYIVTAEGYQNYNGLQSTLLRRFSHGITAESNYTWSHAIGDIQGFSQGGLYTSALPKQTATLERGNSDLDIRDRFTLMLNYQVPFEQSLTGLKRIVSAGWQFNAIDVWETGSPFSIGNASPQSNTGIARDRPNQIGQAALSNPSIKEWFNTSAFQAQTFGTIGSARRDSVYGPHFRHFDASVFKDFEVGRRFTIQARAEVFNLTNTPNFGGPADTLGIPGFGTISSTRVGSAPRQIQFATKILF